MLMLFNYLQVCDILLFAPLLSSIYLRIVSTVLSKSWVNFDSLFVRAWELVTDSNLINYRFEMILGKQIMTVYPYSILFRFFIPKKPYYNWARQGEIFLEIDYIYYRT